MPRAACLVMDRWEFPRDGSKPIPMTSEGPAVFLHRETPVCTTSTKDETELLLGCIKARTALMASQDSTGDSLQAG